MKTIIKTIRMNLDDLGVSAAILGGAFLLLEGVIAVIMLVMKERAETSAAMGWIMLPVIAGFVCLFFDSMEVVMNFDLMLRYGRTRKTAIASTVALILAQSYFSFALAFVLGEIDRLIAGGWLRLFHLREIEINGSIPLPVLLALPLGIVVVSLGAGTLLQRFGRKAFWVLWGLWMAFIVFQSAIPWDDIIEGLGGVSPLLTGAAAGAVGLVILALSVWSLMRATVKN